MKAVGKLQFLNARQYCARSRLPLSAAVSLPESRRRAPSSEAPRPVRSEGCDAESDRQGTAALTGKEGKQRDPRRSFTRSTNFISAQTPGSFASATQKQGEQQPWSAHSGDVRVSAGQQPTFKTSAALASDRHRRRNLQKRACTPRTYFARRLQGSDSAPAQCTRCLCTRQKVTAFPFVSDGRIYPLSFRG